MRQVVGEAGPARWEYAPLVSVGPLRFGMSHQQAIEAMEAEGFLCDALRIETQYGRLNRRAEFRVPDAPEGAAPVTTYFLDHKSLAVVAVDALRGPQVWLDAIRLVGQEPSKLTERVWDYVTERGMPCMLSVEGEVSSEELGLMVRAQWAGDARLSRPIFVKCDGWACMVHDCVPTTEWNVR